jgi:hypothetical protein
VTILMTSTIFEEQSKNMKQIKGRQADRRKLITAIGIGSIASLVAPSKWSKPIVDAVILPAHAQTSMMCVTDTTVGGPLIGNASGATTCQAACEAEATAQSAQLCAVTETLDSGGATICGCDLDLP